MDSYIFHQVVNAATIGATYSLVALGYWLTFSALRVVNLSYGDLLSAAALSAALTFETLQSAPLIAAFAGILVAIALGVTIHLLVVMPLGSVEKIQSPRHIAVMVSTLGASLALRHLMLEFFGPYPQPALLIVPASGHLANLQFDAPAAVLMCATLVLLIVVSFLLWRTPFGLRIRALTSNRELASVLGVRVSRDQIACVVLSSALGGLAGILICEQTGAVSPMVGFSYGLKGLIAVIVGRSLWGSVLVGILLGIVEVSAIGFLASSYRDAVVYAVLVAAVLIRAKQENPLVA